MRFEDVLVVVGFVGLEAGLWVVAGPGWALAIGGALLMVFGIVTGWFKYRR